jgi:hypothetical protein
MDFHNPDKLDDTVADSANMDAVEKAKMEGSIVELETRLQQESDPAIIASLQLELGRNLAALQRGSDAWSAARRSFDFFLA